MDNIILSPQRVFHLKINYIVYIMTNKQIKKIVRPKLKTDAIIKTGDDTYIYLLNNKAVSENKYMSYIVKSGLFFALSKKLREEEEESKIKHKPEVTTKPEIKVSF